MVARLLCLGLLIGVLNPLSPFAATLSTAHAAPAAGVAPLAPAKRPAFRPWSYRAGQAEPLSRSRTGPAARNPSTPAARARRDASVFSARSGARKAVPVTRGQELGLKFRPDERASPYASPGALGNQPMQPGAGDLKELHSQFRPTRPRRKPTYEELQAEQTPQREPAAVPPMPYPVLPAPMPPVYGGPWPRW